MTQDITGTKTILSRLHKHIKEVALLAYNDLLDLIWCGIDPWISDIVRD